MADSFGVDEAGVATLAAPCQRAYFCHVKFCKAALLLPLQLYVLEEPYQESFFKGLSKESAGSHGGRSPQRAARKSINARTLVG